LPSSKRIVDGKSFPISCEHVPSTHWWAMNIGRSYSAMLVFVAVTIVVILGGRVVVAALAPMRKQALE
jgi:hypothetical protein